ncbi:hypothetical protein EMPG_17202 [Blastomyces silverae]|uniref:Uncharacterized protein n=1 Tax=Blastomyces silverae TaxID=2060906 RepID=A0A0H1B8K8_9EURO|nr:hypothetical protein EMPG_17202 [Blastomyces silverae]
MRIHAGVSFPDTMPCQTPPPFQPPPSAPHLQKLLNFLTPYNHPPTISHNALVPRTNMSLCANSKNARGPGD